MYSIVKAHESGMANSIFLHEKHIISIISEVITQKSGKIISYRKRNIEREKKKNGAMSMKRRISKQYRHGGVTSVWRNENENDMWRSMAISKQ